MTLLSVVVQPATADPRTSPALSGSASSVVKVPTLDGPEDVHDHPDMPPQPDDFVRPEPASGGLSTEYTYVSSPLAGTMRTTLVTVQLADKSAAETDSAVPITAARASVGASRDFWSFATSGRVQISIVAERHLHKSAARSTQSPWDITEIVSRELGWSQTSYSALVLFVPGSYLNNGAAGMTYSNGGIGGRILMPQNSRLTTPVLAHEFGHALGMDHANSLQCGSGVSDVASGPYGGFADPSCSVKTYGDNVDLMGISHYDYMPMISASFWDMGRFGDGNEIANLGTMNAARTVVLKPWAAPGAGRAVKFTDPRSGEVYFLELRTPVGYDAGKAVGGNRGVKITQQAAGNASIVLPRSTLPFSGYYSNTQAWQAGSTFVTHAGTRVTIDSLSDSSATVTIRPPLLPAVGSIDSVSVSEAAGKLQLNVRGWALDRAKPSVSTDVHVYLTSPDGVTRSYAVPASLPRPDVNQVMQVSGDHGYSKTFEVTAPGTHKVCVFAIGSQENADLGCRSVNAFAAPAPYGSLDSVSYGTSTGKPILSVNGWSFDAGTPAASIPVHVYVTAPDGKTSAHSLTANEPRPDVNRVFGISGDHGYSVQFPVNQGGTYRVCAYGLYVTPLSEGNSLLGCKSTTLTSTPKPIGFLDGVTINGLGSSATLSTAGWAVDPGTPSASIPVHVYVTAPDGTTTAQALTGDQARPDVNNALGVTGGHGFRSEMTIKQLGTYRVCVYALPVSILSDGTSLLGCRNVTASATPAPVGTLDSLRIESGTTGPAIVARGWTYDPAYPLASIPVHTYVISPDGIMRGTAFTADVARPDVNRVMGVTGNHGYSTAVPVTQRGNYTVCTWGLAASALAVGNTQLGCQTIGY